MDENKEWINGFSEKDINSLLSKDNKEFTTVEKTLLSSEPEDGGDVHYIVIKRLSDDKYFHAEFNDWEYETDGHGDSCADVISFEECFPKQKTITYYE